MKFPANAGSARRLSIKRFPLILLVVLAAVAALAVTSRADTPPGKIIVSSAYKPPVRCDTAQQAITFYRDKYRQHRERMGLSGPVKRVWYRDCDTVTRRAGEWRERARFAKVRLNHWVAYHWNWSSWLPDKWQRIGACETGYGRRPGNWQHNSGTYQGAFGFYHGSWDAFVPRADPAAGPYPSEAYLATPRQQWEVALAIWRRYGFSGWGCRNA